MDSKKKKSATALKVNEGIESPPPINEELLKRPLKQKDIHPAEYYVEGIIEGNRSILSQAITLVESSLTTHQKLAQKIIESCLKKSGNSVRIGITGIPGVGKSTFIEAFGKQLTQIGHKVAVLAIDPSSQRSKGSILGDKTRMMKLSADPNAYIRPSPSAGSLGGVARKTRETVTLCEAAGFDIIIIETVGVGQSETAVHSMVDFFLLLMLAGAGDDLQGIKRGIMEMADAIVINKADGDNLPKAQQAKSQYESALHLFPPKTSGWSPKVLLCSSIYQTGISQIWDMMNEYIEIVKNNGYFWENRKRQSIQLMNDTLHEYLLESFFSNPTIENKYQQLQKKVINSELNPYKAAHELFDLYLHILSTQKA
ncbi:MAG TPA: methylmalonyl Co-A mutase-associated GTPase MeaB [Bacteroidales bacterium]|nr:methylmalonyl Co-A mutase-associated GTPase MeaB [Bacteroidales bacterium]